MCVWGGVPTVSPSVIAVTWAGHEQFKISCENIQVRIKTNHHQFCLKQPSAQS